MASVRVACPFLLLILLHIELEFCIPVLILLECQPQYDCTHDDCSQRKKHNGDVDGPRSLPIFQSYPSSDHEQDSSQDNSNPFFKNRPKIPHAVAPRVKYSVGSCPCKRMGNAGAFSMNVMVCWPGGYPTLLSMISNYRLARIGNLKYHDIPIGNKRSMHLPRGSARIITRFKPEVKGFIV